MPLGYDVFGAITGAFGILGLVPAICTYCYYQLPGQRMKHLRDVMHKTEAFFAEVQEKGLLVDQSFVKDTQRQLLEIHDQADNLQINVNCSRTTIDEFRKMLSGLSRDISLLSKTVESLLVNISSNSEKAKKQLQTTRSSLSLAGSPATGTRTYTGQACSLCHQSIASLPCLHAYPPSGVASTSHTDFCRDLDPRLKSSVPTTCNAVATRTEFPVIHSPASMLFCTFPQRETDCTLGNPSASSTPSKISVSAKRARLRRAMQRRLSLHTARSISARGFYIVVSAERQFKSRHHV